VLLIFNKADDQLILLKKIFLRFLLPICILIGCNVWMYLNPHVREYNQYQYFTILWALLSAASIVLVLSIFNRFLNSNLSWKNYPGFRFFIQMVVGTLLSLVCLNYSYNHIKDYYTTTAADPGQLILMNLYGSAIILPVFSMYFGYQFLKDWRRSELETERLQKENAHSQMMSLKNHPSNT